jgi:CHAD domain-containing protein
LEEALRGCDPEAATDDNVLIQAIRSWERLLKRVRRAAAPVRDLDVQRKLLKKLAGELPELLKAQAERLDAGLQQEREKLAAPLKKDAAAWALKLEVRFAAFVEASAERRTRQGRRADAARTALEAFARLSMQMRHLDAGNLHDFRKGAKKARYMAEAGDGNARAGAVGAALKRLQDAIGDWHDWLMLGDEAQSVLEADGVELTAEIERRRDAQFDEAMKLVGRMRGRLMGEWLATGPGKGARSAGAGVSHP